MSDAIAAAVDELVRAAHVEGLRSTLCLRTGQAASAVAQAVKALREAGVWVADDGTLRVVGQDV
jgi:hypothetical protein